MENKSNKKSAFLVLIIFIVLAIALGVLFSGNKKDPQFEITEKTSEITRTEEATEQEFESQTETTIHIENTTEMITETSTEAQSDTLANNEELTKERAKELLRCYLRANLFGLYVEYEDATGLAEIPDDMYDSSADYFVVTNFSSIEEGKELTRRYLSDNVADDVWSIYKDNFFEINEKVYFKSFGRGVSAYDSGSIEIANNDVGKAIVKVNSFDETDMYVGTFSFEATLENGVWKMTSPTQYLEYQTPNPSQIGELMW